MNAQMNVSDRMNTIRDIFQHVTQLATEQSDDILLTAQLENTLPEFRSIAYEAAAMARAIQDFAAHDSLLLWQNFMKSHLPHAVQIHIGLGWAISQKKKDALPILQTIESLMQPRVLDGLGYCDATFRQRVVIQNKVVPDTFDENQKRGYDQGVGRALWYVSKGNPTEAARLIERFSPTRQSDLWRGLGIAVTYVGGCSKEILQSLSTYTGIHHSSLATGVVLATLSRAHAGTVNDSTDLACQILCNLSSSETIALAEKVKADEYFGWLEKIQLSFGR